MVERTGKLLMALELAILILPVTLFMLVLVCLSYPAYPLPKLDAVQAVFDGVVLVSLIGTVAAWRLAISFLRGGRHVLQETHTIWFFALLIAACIGFLCALIAVEQAIKPGVPDERIGFALLLPVGLLVPVAVHMWWERRGA